MKVEFFDTDLGVVCKSSDSNGVKIRLKTTYDNNKVLSEEDFLNSNPIKIKSNKAANKINNYFRNTDFEWTWDNKSYKKLPNFELRNNFKDVPFHVDGYWKYIMVMYRGRVYYAIFDSSYYPQMQLCDLKTKKILNWTNIRNLAPIFCLTTNKII